jgi:hypothetical protein
MYDRGTTYSAVCLTCSAGHSYMSCENKQLHQVYLRSEPALFMRHFTRGILTYECFLISYLKVHGIH